MARKIIRRGDWEGLRRSAREALHPDPPEPAAPSPPRPPVSAANPLRPGDPRLFAPSDRAWDPSEASAASPGPDRFDAVVRLMRQWNRDMFYRPGREVDARLAANRELAREAINWAWREHRAWCVGGGRFLIELAVHHDLVRPFDPAMRTASAECGWCLGHPERRQQVARYPDMKAAVYRCVLCNNYETFHCEPESNG